MNPCLALGAAIARLGGTAFLINGQDALPFSASVQPLKEKADADVFGTPAARFALYAPAVEPVLSLQVGNRVRYGGATFVVRQVRLPQFAGSAAFVFATLVREEEPDADTCAV